MTPEGIRCPRCGEMNRPGAKPTLEVQPGGKIFCTVCSHVWMPR